MEGVRHTHSNMLSTKARTECVAHIVQTRSNHNHLWSDEMGQPSNVVQSEGVSKETL